MIKTCPSCGITFEPTKRSDQKFCTYTCGDAWHARRRSQERKNTLKSKNCPECDTAFIPTCRNQKFCCKKCTYEFKTRPRLAKLREQNAANPPKPRLCKLCKINFTPIKHDPRILFCSENCLREQMRQELVLNRESVRQNTIRICPMCDTSFNPKITLKEIYCSKTCRIAINRRIYKMMRTCYLKTNSDKANNAHKVLGYSPNQLLEHLQSFPEWNNLKHDSWHLDHIFPIQAFIRNGIKDITLICSLDNLQPMFGSQNCSKGDKYDEKDFQIWLNKRKNKTC